MESNYKKNNSELVCKNRKMHILELRFKRERVYTQLNGREYNSARFVYDVGKYIK